MTMASGTPKRIAWREALGLGWLASSGFGGSLRQTLEDVVMFGGYSFGR